MSRYFKSLSGPSIADRFKTKMFVPEGQSYEEGGRGQVALLPGEQAAANAKALAETKKNWPKCGSNFKYLYTFKDGSTVCTLGWRNEFYVAQMMGQMPDPRLFDAAAREELGRRADVVLDRTPPTIAPDGSQLNPTIWHKPWFMPAAAGVAGIGLILLLKARS